MKITVTTPSIRPELIKMVSKCLSRQTFTDYEWLVGSHSGLWGQFDLYADNFTFIEEPPRREGDYYNLNKCWNRLYQSAKGELVVNIVDGLWFTPDTLQKLWDHYQNNPKFCISAVGDQFDQEKHGKPEHKVWTDPRKREQTFYEISPNEYEMCIASLPRKAIIDVGGIDEEYDKYAALSEKEMAYRMARAGYKFYIDQTVEYRAIKHPRVNDSWDERYNAGCELFAKHLSQIRDGSRLKLDFL